MLGLPFLVPSGNWFGAFLNDVVDAGVFVQGDPTDPETTTSGDPRGTYTPAGALNGAKFLNGDFKVADVTTSIGAFGQQPA